ncbi:hypothetical protein [Paenibacillus sp. Marseille-Q4541]|uniref:RNA polymerase sigma factor n=1 Tax=Paenibacillus sp. Marseille-Q4541 TaxID=2831522 RepID=UPI001BA4619F|nr:hypothetical protein [Paenibacillus sp. Marseille-Q4541]
MNSYRSHEDPEVEMAANNADFEAYEELVQRKAPELYRVSYALSREQARAERLLRCTISAVWSKYRKQKKEIDISLFLMQRLLSQAKKRGYVSGQSFTATGASLEEEERAGTFQVKQMTSHRSMQVEQAIDNMPAETRQVFLLTHLADINTPDITSYIGKSEAVVAERLEQAMNTLASELGEDEEEIHPNLLRQHFAREKEILFADVAAERWKAAIQQGLQDAIEDKYAKRHNRIIASWSVSGVMAVLAVIFILFNPWAPKEYHDALNEDGTLVVPDLRHMMETGEQNNLVREKIDSGEYTQLGHVMETENGVRLILDAAMDLGREKVFWYTLEKGELDHTPFITRGEVMDASETDYIGNLQNTAARTNEDESSSKGMLSFIKMDLSLLKSTEGAMMKFVIETNEDQNNRTYSLTTPYPKLPEEPVKQMTLNESFTVEGQSFQLTELLMTPDYTKVELKQDPENRYSTDSLKGVVLEIDEVMGYGTVEVGVNYLLFPSIYYDEFDDLQLSVANTLVKPDPVLVMDTEKETIVSSPVADDSSKLSIDHSTIEDGYFTVNFPKWEGIEYSVANQYDDAAGNSYFTRSSEFNQKGAISFKLNDFDYVQPLTFHVTLHDSGSSYEDPIIIPLIDHTKE